MSLTALSKGALAQLAHALASGRVKTSSPERLGGIVAPSEVHLAGDALGHLSALGLSGEQAAAVVRLVIDERAAGDSHRIDQVWSGPEGTAAQTRDTAVVVRELFENARERVLVSSYVLYQTRQLFEPLARAAARYPELAVRLFVTVRREWKDGTDSERLVRAFVEQFKRDWPGPRLPELFHDPRGLSLGSESKAVLHAKCVVVDGRRSFVTSANFTEAAHERNFELGLLVDDVSLARSIEGQFDSLIQRRLVERLLPK
jgi:phosphatidylserine/phosphatidylglycerophosphate/cardiolipin synthase-like enzyme